MELLFAYRVFCGLHRTTVLLTAYFILGVVSPGSPLIPKLNSSMPQRNKTDRADSLPDQRWPSLI